MRTDGRLLVVGPAALADAVAAALPRCERIHMPSALAGVWRAGQQPFDGAVLALSLGRAALRAIHSLRSVAPQTRIVVACTPPEEPHARQAVAAGADDYVLEPVDAGDLARALRVESGPRIVPEAEPAPSFEEIVALGEVLQQLGGGPQAVLDRMAALLRSAFDATGVTIRVDDLNAGTGADAPAVLQEPVYRRELVVGAIALARPAHGAYGARSTARLATYARLVEALVAQARERAEWRELAWTDDLSGLRNRRYFEIALDDLVARAGRERTRITVLLFDIDNFKTYNDAYGHETGDALINELALLLKRSSRETDVVARYGGDEFAVVFWDAEKPRVAGSQHPADPMALAERFRRTIAAHDFRCLGSAAPGPVTISGGLACYPWDGATRAAVLRAADEALRSAKRSGKNRLELAGGAPSPETAHSPDTSP